MTYDTWKATEPDDDRKPPAAQRKIVTHHVYPPIPDRRFDWCATFDGDEPNDGGGMAQGYGYTEAEAIADLLENYGD